MESINYPAQIEKASLDLAQVQREAASLRERLTEMESILTLEIANAKSTEGKLLYSNEATRAAELCLRLGRCEDAKQIKDLLARADERRTQLLAQQERLRGEFKLHLVHKQLEIESVHRSLL
jgi:hypothetical protein